MYNLLNYETKNYKIENGNLYIEAVGFDKSDIQIDIDNNYLYVKGKKETPIGLKNLNYRFNISDTIDRDYINAELNNGILNVKFKENKNINLKKTISIN